MVRLNHGYKDVLCKLKGEKALLMEKIRRKKSHSLTTFRSRRESKVPCSTVTDRTLTISQSTTISKLDRYVGQRSYYTPDVI